MDSTGVDNEAGQPGKERASLAWTSLLEFLLFTSILGGGFALLDLFEHGQSIWRYLLHGAFISAGIVLALRILNSRTIFTPR